MGCTPSTQVHPEPKTGPDGVSEGKVQKPQLSGLEGQVQQRHRLDQDPQQSVEQRAQEMETERRGMERRRELRQAMEQRRQKKRRRLQNLQQYLEQERQEARQRRQEDEQRFPTVQDRPVAHCGVRLAWLLKWARCVVVSDLGPGIKSDEVCQWIVIPQTEEKMCRFVDTLDSKDVGSPDFFISHTWGEQFFDLIKLLERRFESEQSRETTFVWLDILAVNQHRYKTKESLISDDIQNLAETLNTVHKTIFCIDWSGSTLKRIWCLYELWQTLQLKGAESVEVQVMDLPQSMPRGGKLLDLALKQLARCFDVETQAQASREDDRLHILAEIKMGIGCEQLAELIKNSLVKCVVLEAEDAMEDYVLWQEQQQQRSRASNEDMALVNGVLRSLFKMSVVIECVDAKKNRDEAVRAYELSKKNTELCYKWYGDSKETVDALRLQGRLSQQLGDVSNIKEYQRLMSVATDMAIRNIDNQVLVLC